ncbi:MAG: NADP-binding protein [Acetobacteraceae bacterium]|nr:NADP-binding protein [Acetobacteraceae bacterium]
MGGGMARAVLERRNAGRDGLEIVAAVDRSHVLAGRDLSDVVGLSQRSGVRVSRDAAATLQQSRPDVVIISTRSELRRVAPQIRLAVEVARSNCITIAEEAAYPWAADRGLAEELDRLARLRGVTVLGTGVNPGFVLDALVIALTGVCLRVDHVRAERINDLSPFGSTVMKAQGVGLTPEDFREGVRRGSVVGHVGFAQSLALIARALGWRLDRVEEVREPILSSVRRSAPHARVEPGRVAGCLHLARGLASGREVICLVHPQQVCPEAEGVKTGDFIAIRGQPDINLSIRPEIPGGTGTVALALNMIPTVVEARPGFLTMADLPLPRSLPQVLSPNACATAGGEHLGPQPPDLAARERPRPLLR